MMQRSSTILTPQMRPPHLNNVPAHRRSSLIIQAAGKKNGGGGGGGNKKKGSSLVIPPKVGPRPYLATPVIMQNLLLIESHFRKTGRPLFEEIEISEVAKTLWEAPFPVLAHDASPDPGPLFVYANNAALELFETDWDSLIGTPSTKSAEPVTEIQDDRASALSQVLEKGFIDDYEGERISFKGTKFKISRSTVFNVDAPSGERVGQAAVIRSWEFEDGRKGGEAAAEEAAAAAAAVALAAAEGPEPTAEELSAAEAAVTAQAGVVRDLKEVGGLKNSSEEVVAAVLMLMEKKAVLDALKAKVGGSEETA